MAGRWEFPGGKLGFGEDSYSGLKRELAEELGIDVREARPLIRLRYDYPDRRVMIEAWQVTAFDGEPKALDSQALTWVRPDELPRHDLLEADRAIVTALRLPRLARVLSSVYELAALNGSAAQTILWQPAPDDAMISPETVRVARAAGHRVFVFGSDLDAVRDAALAGCDGAVLPWQGQSLHVDRDGAFLIGVHCEDAEAAHEALEEGAHFLVVAPEAGPMEQQELETLCETIGLPVFAGWYPNASRLERVQQAGAHGCALQRSRDFERRLATD